jgi:hypothetical protein
MDNLSGLSAKKGLRAVPTPSRKPFLVPSHPFLLSAERSTPPQLGGVRQPGFRSCERPLAVLTLWRLIFYNLHG